MASTYLQETTLGTATDATKFTYSAWVKRSSIPAGGSGDYELLLGSRPSHQDGHGGVWLWLNGELAFYDYPSAGGSPLTTRTSFKLFDVNAWYHIVVVGDASQSGTDKLKFYINGELQTAFDEDNRSSFATIAHSIHDTNYPVQIGGRDYAVHYYFNGYMSHVHFIDGTAYPASTFGSTDSTTGQWKINTSPSVTYGNNGFFILKDGNSVTDQSGNSNNFTVGGGTLTKSEDNPSNVFATFNRLMLPGNMQYQNGNTSVRPQANSVDFQAASTLAFKTGKFYAEFKYLENDGHQMYGISTTEGAMELLRNGQYPGQTTTSVAIYASNGSVYENNSATSYGSGFANNAIIMMAVDADNNKIYFGSNGTWYNSGNPSSGTNGYSFNATNLAGFKYMTTGIGTVGYDNTDANFGNGYFGTTAITSEGTNASGNGKFEYDVPTGYTALCTKGLNL